mmetsp:Transcript_68/g.208  ORF Transcript_68/g.208 Transcript_68/m.208 type:complete len:502 (-) Transcript_68:1187-2692(-)
MVMTHVRLHNAARRMDLPIDAKPPGLGWERVVPATFTSLVRQVFLVPCLHLLYSVEHALPLGLTRLRLRLLEPTLTPGCRVLHHRLCTRQNGRQHLNNREEKWRDQELNETNLRKGSVHLISVVEGLNWDANLPLLVSLAEELFQHLIRPDLANPERLVAIRNIRHVEDDLDKHLPGIGLAENLNHILPGEGCVLREASSGGVKHFRVDLVKHLHLLHHGEVVHVVRMQDRLNASLSDLLELVCREVSEDVALRGAHELEEPGTVHVLERRLVVVPQGQLVRCLHKEDVVQPRMAHIVAGRTHQESVALQGAKVVLRATYAQQPVHAVGHVHGMIPGVVRHAFYVASLCGLQEVTHNYRVEFDTVIVETQEVSDRSSISRRVQLQGIDIPGVEQLRREPCTLDHGRQREGLVKAVLISIAVQISLAPPVVLVPIATDIAVEHVAVALAHASHSSSIDAGAGEVAETDEFLQDLLEKLGLASEDIVGAPVVVVNAVLGVVAL